VTLLYFPSDVLPCYIFGSHSSNYEHYSFLGYNVMYQTTQCHTPEYSSFHTSLEQPFLNANFKSLTPL
jgi:hypothetical protein